MLAFFVVAFVMAYPPSAEAVGKGKAVYIGGTVPGLREMTEAPIDMKDASRILYGGGKAATLTIPWGSIEEVEYGQRAEFRVATAVVVGALALFKKARHHFVTFSYKDSAGITQVAMFEFDKNDIRQVLAVSRARTGREITFQDGEARKQFGGGKQERKEERREAAEEERPE
jgi:hypothetical protein